MVAAVALGFGIPAIDAVLQLDLPVFAFDSEDPARGILETIATVTVAVAGVAFSVTIVTFTLAASQLSPRVLRSFRADKLSQGTLALFLGTAVYCLVVLVRLGALAEGVPNLSISLAIVLALASFGLFAVFVAHIVNMLQPSSLIAAIERDGRAALDGRYPAGVGEEPPDRLAASAEAQRLMREESAYDVSADREGYFRSIRAEHILEVAAPRNAFVRQLAEVGDYVLPGDLLARVWCLPDDAEELTAGVRRAFELGKDRSPVQDFAFPIRQLADVALKGLSPGINDPTTAENAMGALTALLLRLADAARVSHLRVDGDGRPRLLAATPGLDDLVRLGFDQVRVFAASDPAVCVRLVELLDRIVRAAERAGLDHAEAARQAALARAAAEEELPTRADAARVRSASDL